MGLALERTPTSWHVRVGIRRHREEARRLRRAHTILKEASVDFAQELDQPAIVSAFIAVRCAIA